MKAAAILALLAATALAEGPGLTVRVHFSVEALSEGERAVATFHFENEGTERVVLLAIEPEDAVETLGGRVSLPVGAFNIEEDTEKGLIRVHGDSFRAMATRVFVGFVRPVVLDAGEERHHEVVFKAPAGHLYAIHFRATYVTVERVVSEQRAYFSGRADGIPREPTPYHRAESVNFSPSAAIIRVDGLNDPDVAHVALAVEVKPREFSFAAAAKEAGVVPEAATWFEPRNLWALATNGKTYLVAEGAKSELVGNLVPFLSEIGLLNPETVPLSAPGDDALANWLKGEGVEPKESRDGPTVFPVPIQRLPELLQKADELGFEVTRAGWKKRQ